MCGGGLVDCAPEDARLDIDLQIRRSNVQYLVHSGRIHRDTFVGRNGVTLQSSPGGVGSDRDPTLVSTGQDRRHFLYRGRPDDGVRTDLVVGVGPPVARVLVERVLVDGHSVGPDGVGQEGEVSHISESGSST